MLLECVHAGKGGEQQKQEAQDQQAPGGGCGALSIRPTGVLEITQAETRFIPIGLGRKLAGVLLVGFLLGVLIAGKRSKRD
jgi:uncharacterized spore protein YtfJ